MKITQVICLMMGLSLATEMAQAQTTTAPAPTARVRRNFDQVDANAPASKYDIMMLLHLFSIPKMEMSIVRHLESQDLNIGKTEQTIN